MRKMKATVCMVIAFVLLINCSSVITGAQTVEMDVSTQTKPLEGKTMSILGDSISTFKGVSSGVAAETTNSTIGDNGDCYSPGVFGVYLEDTWWYQAAETLGMEILVNNSWSASCIRIDRAGPGAYKDRAVQLHDDTGENAGQEPDLVAVYMGTNDFYNDAPLGTEADIDYESLIVEDENGYTYATPNTVMEAYAIMLHKITTRYKDAEVYCFTILPMKNAPDTEVAKKEQFNQEIGALANHFEAYLVDIYSDSGIPAESEGFDTYMGDIYHPNPAGMDAITDCFVDAVIRYSDKMKVPVEGEVGDVNQDGEIRASDALLVLQNVVGLTELSYEQQVLAEVNQDTVISAEDALMILQYVVRLIDAFPV